MEDRNKQPEVFSPNFLPQIKIYHPMIKPRPLGAGEAVEGGA